MPVKHEIGKTKHRKLLTVLLQAMHAQVCRGDDTLNMHCVPALSIHCFQAAVRFSLVGLDSVAALTL